MPQRRSRLSLVVCAAALLLNTLAAAASQAVTASTPLVIERMIYTFVVEANGSSREILTSVDRITSELGVIDYSEASFNFSTSKSSFKVHEAYTLTPRGERVNVPERAIRYVDEASDSDASMFTDRKDVVIVFPNTSVGSRLVTVTEEQSQRSAYPGHYTLALSSKNRYIAEYVEHRFFIHPKLALAQHSVGLENTQYSPLPKSINPTQRQAELTALNKGYKFLGFQFQNEKPQRAEPEEADLGESGTLLLLSTFKDHAALAKRYQQDARPKTKASAAVAKKARELSAGLTTDYDKAKAIYNWINQNIRYVAIYLDNGGLVPNTAESIFRNRYGDCKDHVVLLESMLRAVGIESEPVLVNSGTHYHLPPVALVYPFNHVISFIPVLNLYADPTAQFSPFGILPFEVSDKPVVHAQSGRTARTPVYTAESNLGRTRVQLRLDSEGVIHGNVSVEVKGNAEMLSRTLAFERQDSDPGRVSQRLLATNREIGTGQIFNSDPRDMSIPFKLGSEFQLESHVDLPGPGAFTIPVGLTPAMLASRVIRKPPENRTKPFTCEPELIEEYISFDLGSKLSISRLPQDVSFSAGRLKYQSSYRLTDSEGRKKLDVTRILEVRPESHVCAVETQAHVQELFSVMRRDLRQLIFYE